MGLNIKFCALLVGALFLGCDNQYRVTADSMFLVPLKDQNNYDLKKPAQKYFLPYVLEEISGLSFVKEGVLACIQDEDGKLFLYDYQQKKITKVIKFSKQGDYEGVEIIQDEAYVVKSNGDLYSFNINTERRELVADKIETPLSKTNDVEGLAFDTKSNKLLLVCKAKSDIKNKKIKGRAVFAYDPSNGDFDKDPLFSITRGKIKDFLETYKDKIYEEKRINFHPSGIALHPVQDKFYILASTGKLLVVVDRNGNIEGSYPIAPRILGQPEGICFAPNGDMFIASEGEGDRGYILRFEME